MAPDATPPRAKGRPSGRPFVVFGHAWVDANRGGAILLADIAYAWKHLQVTRSRNEKIARLASVLGELPPDELAAGTAMLAGEPRQGRIGVGYRTVQKLDAPASHEPTLTVTEVDEQLTQISTISGEGSVARRHDALTALFCRATADEQDYLRGLLLGNLRQGALEGVVIEAVAVATGIDADAVRRAAMLTGDVTTAAVRATTGGAAALSELRLEVFRPVQPMLAHSAPSVAEALDRTGAALVETKLDGMRIQVHRDGARVKVFTRNLRDVTSGMPDVVARTRALEVSSIVLDGEAMGLDADGRPVAFQESMQADTGLWPWFFDLLHLDGRDLIDAPLAQRLDLLDQKIPSDLRPPATITDDPEEGHQRFADAVRGGFEGVVVKALDAPYEAGRRGASWVKVKPSHTLDLVVVAVEWGSGRRRGWLSNLHLAALDPDAAEPDDRFVMLGKTFKGMTDEMLEWQTERLLELEVGREGHIVRVRPELVAEIAFDGIQTSSRYPGGMALRFARIKRYRPDKDPEHADTIATVRDIHAGRLMPEVG